ncbi:hypothetical protein JT689_01635 (plasmid) [Halobacterium sp. GSL-19]|uniref:hypothetical protein n=1 Tax=Halobacterium sp. GSL-19 TaxID=2812551 RepID=UPI001964A682|nr:hypothetical protein [Halobacterium sp. GSL-19]QRY21735.1 hypothetical protein JT689_01635 [Halobacterium sp. GSL-19]
MDFLDIQMDDRLSCREKLDKVQELTREIGGPPPSSLYYISDILEECVQQEHEKALETVYLIARENLLLPSTDLRHGLKAVGQTDIKRVNQFIEDKISEDDIKKSHYLSQLVTHLYAGQTSELANQLEIWYDRHTYFFVRAVENTLKYIHNADDESTEEIQSIKSELNNIARQEGLDPSDNFPGNSELTRTYNLLEDLNRAPEDIDYEKVRDNITSYPNLEGFFKQKPSWLSRLKDHNRHPLAVHLSHQYSSGEAKKILEREDTSQQEQGEARISLKTTRLLSYYDHCFEVIQTGTDPDSDPTSDLRGRLLNRESFKNGIAELEIIHALRREFGTENVEIEPDIPNTEKQLDAKIHSSDTTIWVEIKYPDPSESAAIGDRYSLDMDPESSPIRNYVTKKLENQISPAKQETGDLTMFVVKNEPSVVDNTAVKSYVTGPEMAVIPKDEEDPGPVLVQGESGLGLDEETDDLDFLVNYSTVGNVSELPYINSQIAVLNELDQDLMQKLASALSAEKIYKRTSATS